MWHYIGYDENDELQKKVDKLNVSTKAGSPLEAVKSIATMKLSSIPPWLRNFKLFKSENEIQKLIGKCKWKGKVNVNVKIKIKLKLKSENVS